MKPRRLIAVSVVAILFLGLASCRTPWFRGDGPEGRVVQMTVTAYCPCDSCCGWERDWLGRAIYSYGEHKGERKRVGVTADGSNARHGMIAADTRCYPFGTRLYVPGYGYGVVRDRGGDIQGPRRLDLFFPRHRQALAWGRQTVDVVVVD